jgi:YidC/Oxa1 family membrane protein insertase
LIAVAGLVSLLVVVGIPTVWGYDNDLQQDPITPADRPSDRIDNSPIIVRTRSYDIHLSPTGGVAQSWDIIDPVVVGAQTADSRPKRHAGLIDADHPVRGQMRPFAIDIPFRGEGPSRNLNSVAFQADRHEDGDWHVIRFRTPSSTDGLTVTKTFRIPTQGFDSRFIISLRNDGEKHIEIGNRERGLGIQLGPGLGSPPQPVRGVGGGLYSFVRPVLGTPTGVRQLEVDPKQTEVHITDSLRWGGIHQRYFLAALHPTPGASPEARFCSARLWFPQSSDDSAGDEGTNARFFPILTLEGPPLSIAPGSELRLEYSFFFGPKDRKSLRASHGGLDDVLFSGLWGWMRWLCFAIMRLLDLLHAIIPSWGLAIIALAVVIRLLTLPVAHFGIRHQAKIAAQQGEFNLRIAEINEKYKNDPKKRSQESWKAYKEHGVGPVSTLKGCLWLIIQIPIFVALFNLLGQSFALRGASFLWIDDLAEPDRLLHLGVNLPFFGEYFNILPFLMAATQVFVSNFSSSSQADPKEKAKQMWFMVVLAVVFLVLFYSFPAGLVMYWMTSNLAQLLQQRLVGRSTAENGGAAGDESAV